MSNKECCDCDDLGIMYTINCEGTLSDDAECCPRMDYPGKDALEDAYNQGRNKGYCDGVEVGREDGYCKGYEQGAREACENTKQKALDCVRNINCR
ncbi:hypothetical protein [Clostridium beijerinckii]|uniref:hypothetical protein n=1 Tax=Clostridium beijerinckii TaxID=1520 RepID=UPI0002FD4E83|nr:hypothetical protein [Clostridium beijerinckii]